MKKRKYLGVHKLVETSSNRSGERRKQKFKRGCLGTLRLMFFVFIALFLILSIIIFTPPLLNMKRAPWQSRAKYTLRQYGEVQLAYTATNLSGDYATWEALDDNSYIVRGYNRGNIIENYSVWTDSSSRFETGRGTFTAIAFPRTTDPPGYLSTFLIREDQTLRVYRPRTPEANAWGEDGDFGGRTWEPIR